MNLYLGAWHSCTVGLLKTLKQLEELNLQVWQFSGLRSQNVGGSPDLPMPWMVNGCGLITDNDFQISIKTFFTIFYIPYILWLYKTGFVMGQGESTHGEQPSSGPVWRHGRVGEEKPLQPRHINPYIRIQSLARPPDPSTQPRAVWNIKYERNIFPFFCCEWNHKPSCRHTRTHFTWCDAAAQPRPASDQMDVGDN